MPFKHSLSFSSDIILSILDFENCLELYTKTGGLAMTIRPREFRRAGVDSKYLSFSLHERSGCCGTPKV